VIVGQAVPDLELYLTLAYFITQSNGRQEDTDISDCSSRTTRKCQMTRAVYVKTFDQRWVGA